MNKVIEAVDQARDETRTLYRRIRESTGKNHAAIRADIQDASAQAQRLASTLKTLASDRRIDEKAHLDHAASLLETAAAGGKSVASATAGELRKTNMTMLEHTRDAVQDISQAIAAKRRTANG